MEKLAKRYPDAYILLLYGLMETTLTEAVKMAEEQCRKDGVKCSFTELPLSDKQDVSSFTKKIRGSYASLLIECSRNVHAIVCGNTGRQVK